MTHCPSSFCSSAGLLLVKDPARARADSGLELSRVCFWQAPEAIAVTQSGRAQDVRQRVPITVPFMQTILPPEYRGERGGRMLCVSAAALEWEAATCSPSVPHRMNSLRHADEADLVLSPILAASCVARLLMRRCA